MEQIMTHQHSPRTQTHTHTSVISGDESSPAHNSGANGQNNIAPADELLLTEVQVAKRWGLASPKKLQADRVAGVGCPFVRLGRAVRYRLSDLVMFERSNLRTSTSEG